MSKNDLFPAAVPHRAVRRTRFPADFCLPKRRKVTTAFFFPRKELILKNFVSVETKTHVQTS